MGQCYVLLLAIFLVLFEEVRISVAKDTCYSDSDCKNARFPREYCCRGIWRGTDRICRDVDSCNRHYCLFNSDCNGPGKLCCVSNTCTFDCQTCLSDKDCKAGQYCCYSDTRFSIKKRCAVNCLGKYCLSSCGGSQECCRSDVCVNCSKPGCRYDFECASEQRCCKNDGESFCNASCIGAACATDDDCAGYSECCHDKKCVKCSNIECSSNSDCASGYCCRRQFYGIFGRCSIGGCVGQSCDTSGDCGGLGECCRDNKCAHCSDSRCKEHTECPVGEFCCNRNGRAICRKGCVGLYCNSREDCAARGECCTKNKCTECSNDFLKWLIGVIVGILLLLAVFAICLYVYMGRKEPTQSSREAVRRQNNHDNETRHSSNFPYPVDPPIVDDGQSFQLGDISARPLLPQQPPPYHSAEINNDSLSVKHAHLPVGNMNEKHAIVVPSASPAE